MTSTATALPARTLRANAAAMGERHWLPVQTKSRVGTPAMLPPEPVVDAKRCHRPFGTVASRNAAARRPCLTEVLLHARPPPFGSLPCAQTLQASTLHTPNRHSGLPRLLE